MENVLPRFNHGEAWLRLLRLPNLLTVPGDILAGFLLAPSAASRDWVELLLAIPAGLLLYAAGLCLNDLFDYKEDLRDRPERPLPSGKISREETAAFSLIFLWVAAFLAAFFDALPVAIPLILCIILYNVGIKRHWLLGPLLMGTCRAANLLLGAAAASEEFFLTPGPLAAAAVLGLYIAAVSFLARNEARPGAKIQPHHIGLLLRMLIPLQAVLCLSALHRFPSNLVGLLLLPLLPLHQRWSRRFPPS